MGIYTQDNLDKLREPEEDYLKDPNQAVPGLYTKCGTIIKICSKFKNQ